MLVILLLFLPLCAISAVQKALLIGLDGLRADCASTFRLPALHSIGHRNDGYVDYENHRAEYPYISSVNWVSMLTGVNRSTHGVTKQFIDDIPPLRSGSSISDILRSEYPRIKPVIEAPLSTAGLYVWNDLKTVLSGSDYLATANHDHVLASKALTLLRTDPTLDLLIVIFDDIDWVGHHLGGFDCRSDPYRQRVEETDLLISELLTAITNRTTESENDSSREKEDWLIIVSNDHGGKYSNHNGESPEERNRFVIASHSLPQHLKQLFEFPDQEDEIYEHETIVENLFFGPAFVTHYILDWFGIGADEVLGDQFKQSYIWKDHRKSGNGNGMSENEEEEEEDDEEIDYLWWIPHQGHLTSAIWPDLASILAGTLLASALFFLFYFWSCWWNRKVWVLDVRDSLAAKRKEMEEIDEIFVPVHHQSRGAEVRSSGGVISSQGQVAREEGSEEGGEENEEIAEVVLEDHFQDDFADETTEEAYERTILLGMSQIVSKDEIADYALTLKQKEEQDRIRSLDQFYQAYPDLPESSPRSNPTPTPKRKKLRKKTGGSRRKKMEGNRHVLDDSFQMQTIDDVIRDAFEYQMSILPPEKRIATLEQFREQHEFDLEVTE